MKIALIRRISDYYYLGSEYEEPFQYSEHTSGGGCWDSVYKPLDDAYIHGEEFFKLSMFPTKKEAKEYIELHYSKDSWHGDTRDQYEVVLAKDT